MGFVNAALILLLADTLYSREAAADINESHQQTESFHHRKPMRRNRSSDGKYKDTSRALNFGDFDMGMGMGGGNNLFHRQGGSMFKKSQYRQQKQEASAKSSFSNFESGGNLGLQNGAGVQCQNGFSGQVMNRIIQTISLNTDKMMEIMQSFQATESRFENRINSYDSRLLGIDQKLDQMSSQIATETSNNERILQYSETTNREVKELRVIESRNEMLLGKMNDDKLGAGLGDDKLQFFKNYLAKLFNLFSQSAQEGGSVLDQIMQSVRSLSETIIAIRDTRSSNRPPMTAEMITRAFDASGQRIVHALRSQIQSIQDTMNAISSNLTNFGSHGSQWSSGLDAQMNMERMMKGMHKIVVKLLAKAREGCQNPQLAGSFGKLIAFKKKREHHEKHEKHEREEMELYNRAAQSGGKWQSGDTSGLGTGVSGWSTEDGGGQFERDGGQFDGAGGDGQSLQWSSGGQYGAGGSKLGGVNRDRWSSVGNKYGYGGAGTQSLDPAGFRRMARRRGMVQRKINDGKIKSG